MILEGNQRGGAKKLALHLLNERDNDHVELHERKGFVGDNLVSALNEIHAVSRGTQVKHFFLSLNPLKGEQISTESFVAAIKRIEKNLELTGQPRAIVFREKKGRRHCHAVWSRIDTEAMKAINLSFYKRKLRDVSCDLYLEHGWTKPKGFIRSEDRDPNNFTLAQWNKPNVQEKTLNELRIFCVIVGRQVIIRPV